MGMCRTGGEEEEMRWPALCPRAGIPGDGEGARCSAKHETGDGGHFTQGVKRRRKIQAKFLFSLGDKSQTRGAFGQGDGIITKQPQSDIPLLEHISPGENMGSMN